MPALTFGIVDTTASGCAAVPTLIFKLRIENAIREENIHSVVLRCQIQINVTHRRYNAEAKARLLEIFGEPKRWSDTLRPFLWTHANTSVPQFSESITIDLPVPYTYDFEVAGTKYFVALGD